MGNYSDLLLKYEEEYKEKHNIPDKAFLVSCVDFNNYINLTKMKCRMWISGNCINLVSIDNCSEQEKILIDISDIVNFKRIGDISTYSNVTGGGNNGSSIKGAIVGGILAGGAGAIIGSRAKSNEIKTEMVTKDDRVTYMTVSKNSKEFILKFESNDYDAFMKLIPEKEVSFVSEKDNAKDDIYDQLKKLSELKNCGILTEEEFNEKKKILLDKIA